MGRCIAKIGGKYLEWSTVVDAPVTHTMTLAELKAYYLDEYGRRAADDLPNRLERVEATSTSSLVTPELEDLIAGNRAGEHETELTPQSSTTAN